MVGCLLLFFPSVSFWHFFSSTTARNIPHVASLIPFLFVKVQRINPRIWSVRFFIGVGAAQQQSSSSDPSVESAETGD